MSIVSKARLIKLVFNHPWEFSKAEFVPKIGQVGEVFAIDQTDFVFHNHIRFTDDMVGVFLDEEIEEIQ